MIWMDVDTALSEVPVNTAPLVDDTDFKTLEESIAYNESGMDLIWHFVTTAGATSATAVTPTTSGDYDWAHQDGGMYTIEIPASGGASANNDTEGFGYFTGVCDGVLPWRGPTIGFRAAAKNNALIDGGDNLQVDAVEINSSTDAAAQLAKSAAQIISGTVSDANTTPTTTVFAADDITEATADHYNGRVVIFTSGNLQGQASDITDYALDTGEGKFTVSAMTEAPANNDTFIII